jgi:hypothetical protein
VLTTSGESGTRYCLVHGTVASVAAALQVPCETAVDSMPAPLLMSSRNAQQARAHA